MDHPVVNFQQEIEELKSGGGPEQVAVVEQRALSDKDLNDVRVDLSDTQRQLKEQWASHRKVDDDLLKAMKELETQRIELPKKTIEDYKESIGFRWGLQRMGQVSYEYGYRVALARFQARYPDSEVEDDPFTIRPEDDSVQMETQQPFDDSVSPES
ncbi:hypothetical protein GW17_00044842 [Ensete ventricosum]|nr:hypothetical protein GW17_00044842 [Ensete ventricosum]